MPGKFGGIGTKRPQIDLPLDKILIDSCNPRLPKEYQGKDQNDILKILYRDFDLEAIAYSMAENGYFDEEPIVVVPKNLPTNFDWNKQINDLQDCLQQLANKNVKFTVVEGNRRVATAKLLVNDELRTTLGIKENDLPLPTNKDVLKDLHIIPAIVYENRDEISPYLGVRHITGVLKWDAFAKARYVAVRVDTLHTKGLSYEDAVKEVKKEMGDRSDVIKKNYIYYKFHEEISTELEVDIKNIINNFSLIAVALGRPAIRNYIGIPYYKDIKLGERLISKGKLKNAETLINWIFGHKTKNIKAIITDSRLIGRLAFILADKDATQYLRKTNDLDAAFERSGGEKAFLIKKLQDAENCIRQVLMIVDKYVDDNEVLNSVEELLQAIKALKKAIR